MGDVRYHRDGVGDDTSFCGDMRRVVEGRQPKAAVVAGQEVSFGDAGDGAIS